MNMVIAGAYQGRSVTTISNVVQIFLNRKDYVLLDKFSIESYEVVNEEVRTSAASGVMRGAVGGALFGPVGMLAGASSAKNKGAYTIAIQFKDGKRSLIEIDSKTYKTFLQGMF